MDSSGIILVTTLPGVFFVGLIACCVGWIRWNTRRRRIIQEAANIPPFLQAVPVYYPVAVQQPQQIPTYPQYSQQPPVYVVPPTAPPL